MKKLLVLVLALSMVLSMVACAAPAAPAAEPAAPAAEPAAPAAEPAAPAAEPAPAEEAAPTELDIGVLVWKFDDTYGSTVRAAMDKYAKEIGDEMGIKINLTMQDANDTMATQIEQATIMFAQEPDAVIINLADVSAGQSLIDIAADYDIPYLFYNKEPADPAIITENDTIFVGTTPREAGDMQGEILADMYKADPASVDKNGDGKVTFLQFMGEPANPEAIARSQYSEETAIAQGVPLEKLGETLVCNWDQQQAYDAMVPAFANYGEDIEVIFANNDMMALGCVAALNDVGYNTGVEGDPSIIVIGVDAVDSAMESIARGGMTATVQQDGDAMGKANIIMAINAAMGKDFLDGTDYQLAADGYSVRIPYAKITE